MLQFNEKLLTDSCDILVNNTVQNSYGQTNAVAFTTLRSAVPCRVSQGRRGGREWKGQEKKGAITDYFVYMMPIDGITISEHMWFRIKGIRYNILDVNPLPLPGAPLEIILERIKP